MMTKILPFIAALLLATSGFSQEVWNLDKCIEYARQHNIAVRQSKLSVQTADINLKGSRAARLPNLNGSSSLSTSFGRNIDPTTNDFISENVTFNSMSLNTNLPLYTGNRLVNTIKRDKKELEAAVLDQRFIEIQQLNLISEAYLNILVAEEQLKAMQKSRETTQQQLQQTEKLIRAGVLPENDKLNIEAQLALDDQNVVLMQNNFDARIITLKGILNLPADMDMTLEKPEIQIPDFDPSAISYNVVYETATKNAPDVQSAQVRMRSAELGVPIARSALYPSLSAFGSVSSNYSDAARQITGFETIRSEQTVFINGMEVVIETDAQIPTFGETPYFDQLNNNFGQLAGISLNVPIFNRFSSKNNVARAKLNMERSQLDYEQTLQNYKNQIQILVADVRSAGARYEASLRSRDAQTAAFQNTEKRFQLGTANTFDYATAKNAMERAELELIQAKYNYLYQIKLLEWTMSDYSQPIRFF